MKGTRYYNYVCLPDNLLVQTFERVRWDWNEIRGQVFVDVNGCLEPAHHWKTLAHDGFLHWQGFLEEPEPHANRAYMDNIAVNDRYQRRGLGSILVEHAEKRMRVFGITLIRGIATLEGYPFWKSQGYKLNRDTSWFEKTLVLGDTSTRMPSTSPKEIPEYADATFLENNYSLEQVKRMARDKGVSADGSKRDIIKRILKREVY